MASYQLVQQAAKEHKQKFALFTSEGQTWIEVPFAYDPYWQARGVR